MTVNINRRKFFANAAMSAAGIVIGNNLNGLASDIYTGPVSYNITREASKFRKIDSHIHVWLSPSVGPEMVLDFADRLFVEKLVISKPITKTRGTHKDVVEANDIMINALRQHPDRFIAQFTILPEYAKESLEEIKRCVDNGLIGLKVYYQTKLNDPLYYPIIEKMIDLKMVILMHSYSGLGRGGHRTKYGNLYPNESTPEDFADVARRYPESILQFAHIGGGGDWEYECKVLKDYPNIYVDVSGSNNEENMVNYAVRYLGVDRLFFGSDNSYYQSVSKVLSADITDDQRSKIFYHNYNNMLKKGGYNVD